MTIAITGATGQLAPLIIAALKTRTQEPVIALARTPAKAEDLGVETRAFDYDDAPSLAPALAGVDTLMLVSASEFGKRTVQHRNVIDAAVKAGVNRIVYTSVLHADSSTLSLAGEHRETEAALASSGLDVTILRNGWYTENYGASIPSALEHGAFVGSAGDGRIASAPREDYALAAAVVLASDGHAGRTYELAGDEAYTLADFAAAISDAAGRSIPYVDMPEADYAGVLTGAGFPEPVAQAFASFDTAAKGGALYDGGRELSTLIGRPTTPMAVTVAQTVTSVPA